MGYIQKHGVNIGKWLCHGDAPLKEREKWLQQDDIHVVRDLGLDHVRLCLKEIYFWDEDGNLNPKAIEILRRGIDWSLDAGLVANVNLHILRSHNFNNINEPELFTDPKTQERFVHMWDDLSDQLRDYSTDKLAFEFLNEPVARDNERWNAVWKPVYKLLRGKEQERTLILGSNLWNQTRTFKDLDVPDGDANMMLDFHFYEPLLVSHYRAPWVKAANIPFMVKYPGKPVSMPSWLFGLYTNLKPGLSSINRKDAWHENDFIDRDVIKRRFMVAVNIAREKKLPINLGEFGFYVGALREAAMPWLHDVFSVCKELSISWTIWCYGRGDDGFAIVNSDRNHGPQAEVIREFLS